MIKDRLENAKIYYGISEYLQKGFQWLQSVDLLNLSDGKYEIDGNLVYANVQTYTTKSDAKYESHRRYIDIQYVIQGIEKIGVTNVSDCITCISYDEDKDLEFYDTKTEEEYLCLAEGEFLVLYPHDAHKPSISTDKPQTVKKVVVKVFIGQD